MKKRNLVWKMVHGSCNGFKFIATLAGLILTMVGLASITSLSILIPVSAAAAIVVITGSIVYTHFSHKHKHRRKKEEAAENEVEMIKQEVHGDISELEQQIQVLKYELDDCRHQHQPDVARDVMIAFPEPDQWRVWKGESSDINAMLGLQSAGLFQASHRIPVNDREYRDDDEVAQEEQQVVIISR